MKNAPISLEGIKFIAAFPEWADKDAMVHQWYDQLKGEMVIIVAHPNHPPHRLNLDTRMWEPIKI